MPVPPLKPLTPIAVVLPPPHNQSWTIPVRLVLFTMIIPEKLEKLTVAPFAYESDAFARSAMYVVLSPLFVMVPYTVKLPNRFIDVLKRFADLAVVG